MELYKQKHPHHFYLFLVLAVHAFVNSINLVRYSFHSFIYASMFFLSCSSTVIDRSESLLPFLEKQYPVPLVVASSTLWLTYPRSNLEKKLFFTQPRFELKYIYPKKRVNLPPKNLIY